MPLLTADTLRALLDCHHGAGAAATVLTAIVDNPSGYGRVVRDGAEVLRIVEHRDASEAEREIREINSGIYAFDLEPLFPALRQVASDNAQQEYYLPDLVAIYRRAGRTVAALAIERPDEILGINTRAELAAMSERVWGARRAALMASGRHARGSGNHVRGRGRRGGAGHRDSAERDAPGADPDWRRRRRSTPGCASWTRSSPTA